MEKIPWRLDQNRQAMPCRAGDNTAAKATQRHLRKTSMGSKFKNMGRFLDNPHRLKFTLQIIQPFSTEARY